MGGRCGCGRRVWGRCVGVDGHVNSLYNRTHMQYYICVHANVIVECFISTLPQAGECGDK